MEGLLGFGFLERTLRVGLRLRVLPVGFVCLVTPLLLRDLLLTKPFSLSKQHHVIRGLGLHHSLSI